MSLQLPSERLPDPITARDRGHPSLDEISCEIGATCRLTRKLQSELAEMRGRIMSIYATSFLGLPPIGSLLAGELSRHIPTGHALAAMAGVSLLSFIAFYVFSEPLRNFD